MSFAIDFSKDVIYSECSDWQSSKEIEKQTIAFSKWHNFATE